MSELTLPSKSPMESSVVPPLHANKHQWRKSKMLRFQFPKSYLLLLCPLLLGLIALMLGRYPISFLELLNHVWPWRVTTNVSTIDLVLWQVRGPRVAAALLIGGALALAGSTYQGLFKNPMVSPDLLGASAGAGFGACMGLLLSLDYFSIQLLSFSCGLLAVGCCYLLSQLISQNQNSIVLLVLTGMVISTLFAAFISVTKYLADPYSKLPEITFWLMGSLSGVNSGDIALLLLPISIGSLPLLTLRWRLDILSFGDEAKTLGIAIGKYRLLFIICATLLTSASVSLCGMVGWVGLLIPHLTRMLVGPSHCKLIPYSIAMGASFLLLVDTFARCALPLELPLGILTALIGAPFFLYLLVHGRGGWA